MEKRRSTTVQLPAHLRSASFSSSVVTEKIWPASCETEPENLSSTSGLTVYGGETLPSEYTSFSEAIAYANSNVKWSNPCVHVRKSVSYSSADSIPFLFVDDVHQTYEEDPNDPCGKYSFIEYSRKERRSLTLRDRDVLAPFIGTVSAILPYSVIYLDEWTASTHPMRTTLQRRAMKSMLPSLARGISIPVFLFELRDVPRMIGQLALALGNLPAKIYRLFKKPLNSVSKDLLATFFGWLPFISDLKKIVNLFFSVGERVRQFIEAAGKRRTLHYRSRLSPLAFRPQEWFSPPTSNCSISSTSMQDPFHFADAYFDDIIFEIGTRRKVKNLEYHATMDFMYTIPAMNAFWSQFLGELQAWGLPPSLSDLWEVVPFSFVLDWFFNLGKVLKKFDFENLPIHVVIDDFCDSISYRCEEHVEAKDMISFISQGVDETSSWIANPSAALSHYSENAYYRWVGIPVLTDETGERWKLPRGMQIVLGLALLGGRQRRV